MSLAKRAKFKDNFGPFPTPSFPGPDFLFFILEILNAPRKTVIL